jgi:hypothetical protein
MEADSNINVTNTAGFKQKHGFSLSKFYQDIIPHLDIGRSERKHRSNIKYDGSYFDDGAQDEEEFLESFVDDRRTRKWVKESDQEEETLSEACFWRKNVQPSATLPIDEDAKCEICHSADTEGHFTIGINQLELTLISLEDTMLLCDGCNKGFHQNCLIPPISEIPKGKWFCNEVMLYYQQEFTLKISVKR